MIQEAFVYTLIIFPPWNLNAWNIVMIIIAQQLQVVKSLLKVACHNSFTYSSKDFICYLFYFWLCWSLLLCGLFSRCSEQGLLQLRRTGCSLPWPCLWAQTPGQDAFSSSRPTGSAVTASRLWRVGSAVVAPGLSCSAECGIFPHQGSNQYLLHWQADYWPLSHQRSPGSLFLKYLNDVIKSSMQLLQMRSR